MPAPEDKELTFLYQCEHLFAVDKPPGVHSVRIAGGGGPSLADMLLQWRPDLASVGTPGVDAGLVSRLDYSTSGVLLGATSQPVWERLHRMILSGAVEKLYVAYLQGQLGEQHSVTTFIGSPNRGAKKMKVYERPPPKSARALEGSTTFRPVQYDSVGTWAEVTASPARRHQVRAHAAYLGYPLIGDTLYGATERLPGSGGGQREFILHAARVCFDHPETAARITITASLPAISGLTPPQGV